jgi:Flp pilus assembly protein CpaB
MLFGKMTLVPMSRGQTVLANQVTTSGFSQILGKGKRAFTLAVNERNNFGGMLTENDYIDVLWTHKYEVSQFVPGADGKPQEKTRTLPTTKTLLQDVRVMRVITLNTPSTQQPRADGQNGAATQTAAVRAAPASQLYAADAVVSTVLILEVNDQQAEVLKFANEGGTLDFTLRSSDGTSRRGDADVRGDHDPERTTGITDKVLVEQYGLLLPELLIK